ncbi:MAG TPA: tetratricopeptide repeat protein, partial [Ktedonobacteraceae bacterium]|nr:tetratricopeptide repeat protein [Ktedonobacteraceae bacterium]
ARQQTLRNTLQWSYDLLTTEEQRLFRGLSVFVGGFTLEAATAVCNSGSEPPLDVLTGVASLLDKSLLLQVGQEGAEPRFRMLETLREFGLACLHANGEEVAARRAYTSYYVSLAEDAEPYLEGPELARWLDRLEGERENLGALLQQATTEEDEGVPLVLHLSSVLLHFWLNRWYPSEGRSFLEWGLSRSQAAPAHLRLKALIAGGLLMWHQHDVLCAFAPVTEEAQALARSLEDWGSLTYALTLQGIALMSTRDHTGVRACFEEALVQARAYGESKGLGFVLMNLGILAVFQREHQRAIGLFEESLALYRSVGDLLYVGTLLYFLSHALLREGDLTRARLMLEEAVALARQVRARWKIGIILSLMGQIALLQGEVEQAEALLSESIQISQEMGNQRNMARNSLLLASLALTQGNDARARVQYEEGLALAVELGFADSIALGLKGLACVAAAQGHFTRAALLWGAADNLPGSRSVPIPQVVTERAMTAVRTHLGAPAFAQALSDGRAMTPAQVLAADNAFPAPQIKRSPVYPAGLTVREVEVLRLVAASLTDAQVAEQLVISVRTVNKHLTSIYNKLGVSSRAAATRFAVEHSLV